MNRLFYSKYRTLEAFGLVSFLMVMAVQLYLRPAYGNQQDALSFFLGVAPNLFGAIGLCIANFIYNKSQQPERTKLFLSVISAIGILGIWEAISAASGKPFDKWDIVATVIGALIGLAGLLLLVRKNRQNGDLKFKLL